MGSVINDDGSRFIHESSGTCGLGPLSEIM